MKLTCDFQNTQSQPIEGKVLQKRFSRSCESHITQVPVKAQHALLTPHTPGGLYNQYRLNYAQSQLSIPLNCFIARIGLSNESSIALFEKLGFGKEKVVQVFQEVTLRFGWIEGHETGRMDELDRLAALQKDKWKWSGSVATV